MEIMYAALLIVVAFSCVVFTTHGGITIEQGNIDQLTQDEADTQAHFDRLLENSELFQRKIHSMQNEIQSLRHQVAYQEKELDEYRRKQHDVISTRQADDQIKHDVSLDTDTTDNLQVNHTLQGQGLARKARATGQVAFTAYLGHVHNTVNVGQRLICDQVITNEGNGYDESTGVFTVPETGTYVVTYTIHGISKSVDFRAVVNGQALIDNVVNAMNVADPTWAANMMASNTCVARLQMGQEVWLESFFTEDAAVLGSMMLRYTTFTVFLLY